MHYVGLGTLKSSSPVIHELKSEWTHRCVSGALRIHRSEGPLMDLSVAPAATHYVIFPRVEYRFKRFTKDGPEIVTRRPGEVAFLPVGTELGFQLMDQMCDYVGVAIPAEFFDRVTNRPSVPLETFLSTDPVLASFEHTFAQLGQCQEKGVTEVLEALLAALCLQLSRVMNLEDRDWDRIPRPEVRRVIRAIHAAPAHPWSVEQLAEEAGMSTSQLNRLFRHHLGSSVGDYVIRTRVLRAAALLRSSDNSIEGIAQQCGFYDASHLGRHFRKLMGQSPAHYRSHGPLKPTALLATFGSSARSIRAVE